MTQTTIVATITDLGYCHATRDSSITVEGRKFSAGWALDGRIEMGGPIVKGWHGWLNQEATVISAHRSEPKPTAHANIGDTIVGPDGNLWRIEVGVTWGRPRRKNDSDYLTLVKVEG